MKGRKIYNVRSSKETEGRTERERGLVLMESLCPYYNWKPRKMIACKAAFPNLISKIVSHGVKVTNNSSQIQDRVSVSLQVTLAIVMAAVKGCKWMYVNWILLCAWVCLFSKSVFLLTSECGLISEQMLLGNFRCMHSAQYRSVLAVSFIKCVPHSVSVLWMSCTAFGKRQLWIARSEHNGHWKLSVVVTLSPI